MKDDLKTLAVTLAYLREFLANHPDMTVGMGIVVMRTEAGLCPFCTHNQRGQHDVGCPATSEKETT